GSFEVKVSVAAWQYILLLAERRDKHRVQHVFRRHLQSDRRTHGNMQILDLAAAVFVLELAHPFFTGYQDLQCVRIFLGMDEINPCAPEEHPKNDKERDDSPRKLQG